MNHAFINIYISHYYLIAIIAISSGIFVPKAESTKLRVSSASDTKLLKGQTRCPSIQTSGRLTADVVSRSMDPTHESVRNVAHIGGRTARLTEIAHDEAPAVVDAGGAVVGLCIGGRVLACDLHVLS